MKILLHLHKSAVQLISLNSLHSFFTMVGLYLSVEVTVTVFEYDRSAGRMNDP
jgi:hypothetical protein